MKLNKTNDALKNKIWLFRDSSFRIKFLQIDKALKWIKFSFKTNPSTTYLLRLNKLVQQVSMIEEQFQDENHAKIEKNLREIIQGKQDQVVLNERKSKEAKKVRDIILKSIPKKQFNNIVSQHIQNFKNTMAMALETLEEMDPNEPHDLYGLSFLNGDFSKFGVPERVDQENIVIIDGYEAGFYTQGIFDLNHNATVWHKAINPIIWFGMKMNDGKEFTSDNIVEAKSETDYDKYNVPFVGLEE